MRKELGGRGIFLATGVLSEDDVLGFASLIVLVLVFREPRKERLGTEESEEKEDAEKEDEQVDEEEEEDRDEYVMMIAA